MLFAIAGGDLGAQLQAGVWGRSPRERPSLSLQGGVRGRSPKRGIWGRNPQETLPFRKAGAWGAQPPRKTLPSQRSDRIARVCYNAAASRFLEETAVFDLAELLVGVQEAQRQQPAIPAHLRTMRFSEAVIDSRLASEGSLFVALPGEKVDGHRFINQAVRTGAIAALVNRAQVAGLALDAPHAVVTPEGGGLAEAKAGDVLLVAVENSLAALQRLAAYHRGLFTPTVIGITGSVGKTSTKEVVASVLRRKYRTLKNPRSYNNETTMPIALLELNGDHDVAVLEMGIYGPGDLTLLTSIARPLIGIVTNVGPSHMERMGSIDAVAQAKSELVQALPAEGIAILNYDDERVRAMAGLTKARVFSYGLDPAADIWADQIVSRGLEGIAFRAHHAGESVTLKLPLLGRHSVHTALAAAAAGLVLGLGWDAIVEGLRDESAQLRLLAVPGINGAILIDDTYNASPVSTLAALNLLADLDGRRIAVLGDMLELGPVEEESHRQVGRRAAETVQLLIVVGQRARWIGEEAVEYGMAPASVVTAQTNAEVVDLLRPLLQPGDYVLLKASRGAAMDDVVASLQQPAS